MGYIVVIAVAVLLIPVVYLILARRPGKPSEGEEPIGKPVMVTEPSADEPTPAASSIRSNTSEAQRRTPPA